MDWSDPPKEGPAPPSIGQSVLHPSSVFRPFFPNVLADLQFPKPSNQPRPENQRKKHGGEARIDRSYGDVTEHVQGAEVGLQHVVEEVVKHLSVVPPDQRTPPARRTERSAHRRSVPFSLRASPSPAPNRPRPPGFPKIQQPLAALRKILSARAAYPRPRPLPRSVQHRRPRQ